MTPPNVRETLEVLGVLYAVEEPPEEGPSVWDHEAGEMVDLPPVSPVWRWTGEAWELVLDHVLSRHVLSQCKTADVSIAARLKQYIEGSLGSGQVFVKDGLTHVHMTKEKVRRIVAPEVDPQVWQQQTKRNTGRFVALIDPPIHWASPGAKKIARLSGVNKKPPL